MSTSSGLDRPFPEAIVSLYQDDQINAFTTIASRRAVLVEFFDAVLEPELGLGASLSAVDA